MRESHPYRKVSERKKKKKCCLQPVFNFFEEHASLFHCDTQVAVVGVLFLYRSWPPVLRFLTACRSSICSLFSFVSFFSPRRSYSSAFPRISQCRRRRLLLLLLLLPLLALPCWISCGLHRSPAPPSPLSSSLKLEAIPEYSMMAVHLFPLSLAYAWACQFP